MRVILGLTVTVAALVAGLFAVLVSIARPGGAAAAHPATPAGLPRAIESRAAYVEQSACDPVTRPGTAELVHLLTATYPGTTAATTYQCGTDGTRSEHYDGRAIDWMVSVRNPAQHAAALAFLTWLLAPDAAGNATAMARRLGVMYVIFDGRMWGGWSGRWEDYNGCTKNIRRSADNACHRTHMHISLGWNGAMGRTTYWTRTLTATDFGPCRAADLNWAPRYTHANPRPCRDLPLVRPAAQASEVKKALVTYSGARVRSGSSGPVVTAVQRALHTAASGRFTAATGAAVRRFQAVHHLAVTGAVNQTTWRALLAATR